MSEVVRIHASPCEVGHDEGQRRARQAPGRDCGTLEEDMVIESFHPVLIPHPRGCDFVVGRCPFVEIAKRDPATVCELHLGLTEGAAAVLDEGVSVSLVAKDPQQAGCRVWIRLPLGAETTSA
jgi:hypothetical protein